MQEKLCSLAKPLFMAGVLCGTAYGFQGAQGSPAHEMVSKYCVACHNQKLKVANLVLEGVDAERPENAAETWERVIVKLRSRSMPPPKFPRPDNATYDKVATWLEARIDKAAVAHVNPGGTPGLHRLNRAEYSNAVRDLIAVDVDGEELLPADAQAYGFDTNAEALSIAPALLDRYIAAATSTARDAIGDTSTPAGFVRYGAIKGNANERTYLQQTERMGEQFPLGSRGGIAVRHYFPVDGEYAFKLKLERTLSNEIRGLNVPNQFEIFVDGEHVWQMTLGGGTRAEQNKLLFDGDDALQVRVSMKAGSHQVVATILKTEDAEPEGLQSDHAPLWAKLADTPSAASKISSISIGGPYGGKLPNDSPSRKLIFVCQPHDAAEETPCATKILSNLARRAYRKQPTDADVRTLLAFYKRGRAAADFEQGIRTALERVLVSPDFLFRIETDPADVAPGAVYRVSDVTLASRLSFAVWSSIPDDELLNPAIQGKLSEPGILERQVSRMLASPRARQSLIDNFFAEWLQTRNVRLVSPESSKFPWFDDNLRFAFMKEMDLFLNAQLSGDHSIVDLLTSNETFVNEQLARHYGISGVYGSSFRRVTLTDPNRFGLLGKASVLAVTAYPTRTSPTVRGKWLLENILAAPVPAPPPNIPALEESNKPGKVLTVREMLEIHRANSVCASCHARMDPLGFSLENFDGIGQWRTTEAGKPIDASGVLPDGTNVNGPLALRNAIVAQKEQFVRAVTAKLMTYMLGRGLEYYDQPTIREIVEHAAAENYSWSSVVKGIVKSAPFQMKVAAQTRLTQARLATK